MTIHNALHGQPEDRLFPRSSVTTGRRRRRRRIAFGFDQMAQHFNIATHYSFELGSVNKFLLLFLHQLKLLLLFLLFFWEVLSKRVSDSILTFITCVPFIISSFCIDLNIDHQLLQTTMVAVSSCSILFWGSFCRSMYFELWKTEWLSCSFWHGDVITLFACWIALAPHLLFSWRLWRWEKSTRAQLIEN